MTITEYKNKLLADNEFVLAETKRIQYLYGLKHEIRYAQNREEEVRTESVAEHIFGMHIIVNFFLPLEDPDEKLNRERILEMITWHDIGEIETGDMLGQHKTDSDRERDKIASYKALENLPMHVQKHAEKILNEYEEQLTPEAKFAKAIDKVEVIFEIFDDNYREVLKRIKATKEHNHKTKYPYVENYPYIERFCRVVSDELDRQGFFVN